MDRQKMLASPFYWLEREKAVIVPACKSLINLVGQQHQQSQAQFMKAVWESELPT